MFHIDATFEDIRIIATNTTGTIGSTWQVNIVDGLTGQTKQVELTYQQLNMVLAFNLDPNGEPEGFEKFYEEIGPIFKGLPVSVRLETTYNLFHAQYVRIKHLQDCPAQQHNLAVINQELAKRHDQLHSSPISSNLPS